MSDVAAVTSSTTVVDSNYLQTGESTLVAAEAYAATRGLRPVIIDPADGPCEICAAHKDGRCDRCGLDGSQRGRALRLAESIKDEDPDRYQSLVAEAKALPNGLMGDAVGDATLHVGLSGFQSVKPSHWHLAPVLGVAGREAKFDELCIECYRKDYTAVYATDPPV